MDHLGIPFTLAVVAGWIVIALVGSMIFGRLAHRKEALDEPIEPFFAEWDAQREERVKRAEFRHHTRYARRP